MARSEKLYLSQSARDAQERNYGGESYWINTFPVSSQTTGECYIPDVFHDYLSMGIASLDFARVWNTRGTVEGYRMTAQELETAANHFEALARQCRLYAGDAAAVERAS